LSTNNSTTSDIESAPKKGKIKRVKSEDPSQEEITSKLNGRTLMTYFVLLNKGAIGVRELQRQLGLSSPSVSRYHLDKLVELKLVENQNGIYVIVKKANLPVLASWVLLGKYILPRVLFMAILFSGLFIGYLTAIFKFWNVDSIFVVIFGSLICLYTWLEVIWHYRHKPI
jgi:hypothetical protein